MGVHALLSASASHRWLACPPSARLCADKEDMLYALSLHGYGTARLQRIHEWFLEIVNMPDIMGKTPCCADCMKLLTERHGINFDEVVVRFESREQYDKKESL